MRNKKKYLTCGVDVKIVMQKLKKDYKFVKTIYMGWGNLKTFDECNIGEYEGYKSGDYYFIIFPTDNIYYSECIVLKRRKNK